MKNRNSVSKRTAALLTAAVLLLAGGTISGVRAIPNVQSEYYRAHFYLNHLQVHLLENGEDVCGGVNDLDGENKVTGRLATALGYENDENLGAVEPGKVYREEIAARNGQDISQFVRLTVRKYWVLTDEDGNVLKDDKGNVVKTTALKPSLIHLMYGGSDGYNTSAWAENERERTTESRTYYYTKLLPGSSDTELLFDQIKIDESVAELGETKVDKDENSGKTIYTYVYKYDGYAFFIEADVQAIQPHNIQDAIHSQWGVYNVTATYNNDGGTESGSLTVSN
ncbi:MAG: hypothetical protein IJH77_04470 [Mogibacterium sp.]|nr:hypothetical protein [Mogibacterium sp.]